MKPNIVIENEVYRKVMHWVNKSQYEVSGLGMVRVEKDGVLRVVSAILLPQKNGTAHTDIKAEDVNKALFQLKDSEGDLRWWWHSHVQMGVFWSGTDHDTIKKIGAGGWFAATVFNQKRELKSCYYGAHGQSTPWGSQPLMLDDLTTSLTPLEVDDTAPWDEEYALNVTNKMTPAVVYGGKGSWTGTKIGTVAGTWDTLDETEEPPSVCPPGMPGRVYKRWKKSYKKMQGNLTALKQDSFDMRREAVLVQNKLDDYGFDDTERALFAAEGWTDQNIDDLLEEDFSPSEMLRMARIGVNPGEVQYLLKEMNYTPEDVQDLLENSEAFGENLFDKVQMYGGHHV